MDAAISATELLSRLSASEIRNRLAQLDAERRALITLLRAVLRSEKARRSLVTRERQEASQ